MSTIKHQNPLLGVTFEWTEGQGDNKVKKSQKHITPNHAARPCVGQWGIAIKEWQVIKQVKMAAVVWEQIIGHRKSLLRSEPLLSVTPQQWCASGSIFTLFL